MDQGFTNLKMAFFTSSQFHIFTIILKYILCIFNSNSNIHDNYRDYLHNSVCNWNCDDNCDSNARHRSNYTENRLRCNWSFFLLTLCVFVLLFHTAKSTIPLILITIRLRWSLYESGFQFFSNFKSYKIARTNYRIQQKNNSNSHIVKNGEPLVEFSCEIYRLYSKNFNSYLRICTEYERNWRE